jgi:hypothetical protein
VLGDENDKFDSIQIRNTLVISLLRLVVLLLLLIDVGVGWVADGVLVAVLVAIHDHVALAGVGVHVLKEALDLLHEAV